MSDFTKLALMAPLLFIGREIKTDEQVGYLRVVYGVVQVVSTAIMVYIYMVATSVKNKTEIFVPVPPSMFAQPDEKKKYTKTSYEDQLKKAASGVIQSAFTSLASTTAMHLYFKMNTGMAMQCVLAPYGLYENALVKAVLFTGKSLTPESRIFDEKLKVTEIESDAEVVDKDGEPIKPSQLRKEAATEEKEKEEKVETKKSK